MRHKHKAQAAEPVLFGMREEEFFWWTYLTRT